MEIFGIVLLMLAIVACITSSCYVVDEPNAPLRSIGVGIASVCWVLILIITHAIHADVNKHEAVMHNAAEYVTKNGNPQWQWKNPKILEVKE